MRGEKKIRGELKRLEDELLRMTGKLEAPILEVQALEVTAGTLKWVLGDKERLPR